MGITVYYDGLCHLCSREIDHYRGRRGAENVRFQDITEVSFDPLAEGLDPVAVHRELHVRRSDGGLSVGVDAFIEIWRQLPSYAWLVKVAERPAVSSVMRGFYGVFARIRPHLPRKRGSCEQSPYCEVKR